MENPIEHHPDGGAAWTHLGGDQYVVTGVTTDGKRFKRTYDSWRWAQAINLHRGTKWLLRDGKRYRIVSVYN